RTSPPPLAPPAGDGWEVALSGSGAATYGEPYSLSGTAYRVSGLATLRPAAAAQVRARIVSSTVPEQTIVEQTVAADRDGRFVVTLAVPDRPIAGPRLVVSLGERTIERRLVLRSGVDVELLTDRAMYEPGEQVHVIARVLERRGGTPARGRSVRLRIATPSGEALATQDLTTGESGAANARVALPAGAVDGSYPVEVTVLGGGSTASAARVVRVGRRTVERLLAEIELERAVVAPASRLRGSVTVRAPSGAPVRQARVLVRPASNAATTEVRTDDDGIARFAVLAPAFLPGDSAPAMVFARVVHPAYGTLETSAPYTLARVPWTVNAVSQGGALVPEVDTEVHLAIGDVRGGAPPVGTAIEVSGAGVPGGRLRAATDRHGFVTISLRLPRGAAAQHRGATCAYRVATSINVTVEATPVATARVCVPVAPDAALAIRTERALVAPTDEIAFRVARRPSVRGRPVLVELLAPRDGRSVIAAMVLGGAEDRGALRLPADVVGPVELRARPWLAGAVSVGTGSSTAVLVRPPDAFTPRAEPGADVYRIRTRAQVRLTSTAGTRGWATIVARDLAAHGGEDDFALSWLGGALRNAVTDPSTPEADRILRSALSALLTPDPKAVEAPPLVYEPGHTGPSSYPEGSAAARDVLRDPFARREELLRRGIGSAMTALETRIEQSSARLSPDDAALTDRGGRRGFRPDALARLANGGHLARGAAETLGGTLLTVGMLSAADPSFGFDAAARRVTRRRLVRLMMALAVYLDRQMTRGRPAGDPPERWLSRLVQHGMVTPENLVDGWGRPFRLRRSARPAVVVATEAASWEMVSTGPDGALGSADDLRDPFARVVARGTPYAIASGEDRLMTQLADLGPVSTGGLTRMAQAFAAVTAQSSEELEADAVTATATTGADDDQAFAGLEISGEGAGGGGSGTGVGYGSGRGMLRSRRTAAPRIRAGAATVAEMPPSSPMAQAAMDRAEREEADGRRPMQPPPPPPPPPPPGGTMGQLATLVRERFPATLHVIAEVPLDPSGTTTVEIPTADALTTYRVEAILWTPSGWTWSTRTSLRVDQELVVDAPVPPFVSTGDVLRIPVRASNRTGRPIRARLELAAERGIELRLAAPVEMIVPPHDAVEAVLEARAGSPAEGSVLIRATRAGSTEVLDAARRALTVLAEARAVRDRHDALVAGTQDITFALPADASARGTSSLSLLVGGALFGDPATYWESSDDPSWAAWALRMGREPLPEPLLARLRDGVARPPEQRRASPTEPLYFDADYAARVASALWADRAVADEDVRRVLANVATVVPETPPGQPAPHVIEVTEVTIGTQSRQVIAAAPAVEALLGLGPALRAAGARPQLARDLRTLVQRLRQAIERDVARLSDAPAGWTHVAAALAVTATDDRGRRRARELVRRSQRSVVTVGDRAWLEPDGELESSRGHVEPTALLAIARRALGDTPGAFGHVRALASIARSSERWSPRARALSGAAAAMMTSGRLQGPAQVLLDGRPRRASLRHGSATIDLGVLRAGEHTARVVLPAGTLARAEILVRYGMPWSARPDRPAFESQIEGEVGPRDARAAFVLTVQNRGARVARHPIVEVDLPAGAELDEGSRMLLAEQLAARPLLEGRTLRLSLRPLSPAGRVRIPLPIRWSVGGALRGLGVSAFEENEPGAAGVLAPRVVTVTDAGAEPERPRLPRPGVATPPPPTPPPVPLPRPIDDLPSLSLNPPSEPPTPQSRSPLVGRRGPPPEPPAPHDRGALVGRRDSRSFDRRDEVVR
ncbi:MAG: hypothetical protein IT379_18705, partial [Deltaproteobacteria bacterium]|nr:hypothetical protein [Deltaproteobacteria bacterium]